jgi:predicted RNA binding protein YcfA (HicA-like mRNA interferase family)
MKLPIISGKELTKILLKKGYWIKDHKGSHIHLRHATKRPITVPNHKTISKGTLKEIIKVTELKPEDFE